ALRAGWLAGSLVVYSPRLRPQSWAQGCLGRGGVPSYPPYRVERSRRIRRDAVDVRGGPRPRLAAATIGLGYPLRARGEGAPRRGRFDIAGLGGGTLCAMARQHICLDGATPRICSHSDGGSYQRHSLSDEGRGALTSCLGRRRACQEQLSDGVPDRATPLSGASRARAAP